MALSLLDGSTQQAGDLRASTAQGSPRKNASSCLRATQPPPTTSSPLLRCHCPLLGALGPTGPVLYRSYLHMARALRNIWQTGCFLACHFTLPMQPVSHSYCTDPTTFCIWYLRHNLSAFDTAMLFFLCKFLFTCPFCFWCCSAFIPRIWVMLRGLRGYKCDGGWWRTGTVARLRDGEKGRKAGERGG